jgi:HEAT repeat protein
VAHRLSLDDKLAAIKALRKQPPSSEVEAQLNRGLKDRSNLLVATAAAVVGEQNVRSLAGELTAAFERFLVDPVKDDKLCRAKIAIVQALDRLEHVEPDVFHKAARHVQLEPVWGGQVDTAAPLRSAALVALARIGSSSDLPLVVDSLADPEKDVRITSAQVLGSFGTTAAGLVLRLKVRVGDRDPEVLSECLSGLLSVDARDNFPLVAEFLDVTDPSRCEAAVLALGKSRLPEALEALKSCWNRCVSDELQDQIFLAISMLRQPGAIDYLLGMVASESEPAAGAALSALKIHSHDPRLRERIAGVVKDRKLRRLQDQFEREFRLER